ncbi:MAG: formate dehydrogenase accessory sulfurtransferase FdhD [bacterium]
MEPSAKHTALEASGETTRETGIELIVEEPLEIRINGEPFATIMRTPGNEIELAAGFCFTEGIVDKFADILTIAFCADAEDTKNIINVMTPDRGGECEVADPRKSSGRKLESRSSCGLCGVKMLEDIYKRLTPLKDGPQVHAADIVKMQYRMIEKQELQTRTKGSHAVALVRTDGELVVVREDVGRHNALDKAIGYALMRGIDCSNCVAILSGRISFEMAQKSVRAGIPIVAAVSAATALAVELADRLNCTLIGRLRDDDLVVYTHKERVEF